MSEYEGFYVCVLYSYLKSLGVECISEDVTSIGQIDLALLLQDKIYLFDFKMKNSGELPLE
ncbi:MAG: PD-(D/E)XK nuclease domain-containing protein [Bacteroidia bacterium]|nr:PD-(D/E)XK nuclease domain-containing protein [Bacteroidia bacterium]MDW8302346.1 PD-(D/E)XK nuclease domain-containing protein [Bacteroidia bacterium]